MLCTLSLSFSLSLSLYFFVLPTLCSAETKAARLRRAYALVRWLLTVKSTHAHPHNQALKFIYLFRLSVLLASETSNTTAADVATGGVTAAATAFLQRR